MSGRDYLVIGSESIEGCGISLDRRSLDVDVIGEEAKLKAYINHLNIYGHKFSCKLIRKNKYVIKGKRVGKYFGSEKNIVEYSVAVPGTSDALLLRKLRGDKYGPFLFSEFRIDLLYTFKMSHRFKKNSPHFKKTMDDIIELRESGASIPEDLKDFYNLRVKETYNYKHPKLNQSKKAFFSTEGVDYKYDHDSIHEAVKLGDRPAYQYFKPDQEDVRCSRDMFDALPYTVKLDSVVEESCVLALERCLIPYNESKTPEWAFKKALEKVCTSISSGWWREFAYDNYYPVLKHYEEDGKSTYLNKFKEALEANKIKPHEE